MSDPAFEGNLASSAMGALPMKTASFRSIAEGLNGRPLAEPLLEAAMQRYSRPQPPASEVTIAFGLDTAYLPHAAVVLASLIANAPGAKLRFLIVHDGIPPKPVRHSNAVLKDTGLIGSRLKAQVSLQCPANAISAAPATIV